MDLMFMDESGTPPKPGMEYPRYFVMAGVIIPESSWSEVRDDLLGMKIRRGVRGEIKWRHFAPDNDEAKNPMRGVPQPDRDAIREEMFGIICKPQYGVTSIAAVCSASAAYKIANISDQDGIYHLTYKVVTERFQYFLQDHSTRARTEFGIVVCDHRGSGDDKRLRAHHQMLIHAAGGYTSNYKNLIESVFLQPSHQSIGIQLADIVAGSVWRNYERNDPRFFSMADKSFRRSSSGQVMGYGIVKVPKSGWV
jgi:hypothetical protein